VACLGAAAALLIPGLGPVTLAGVMAGLVAGAGAGAAAGGIVGALTGLGASEEEARYYQQELEAGRALVVVKTDGRSEEATTVLVNQGAYGLAGQRELRM
jgi:hydrogenase maturation factor